MLVDSGPADFMVVPPADSVGQVETLELLIGKGGEAVVAGSEVVSLWRADVDVVRKLVVSVMSGADNVALVGLEVGAECRPVPVTRVPVDTDAEVVLVKGNGAEVDLVLDAFFVTDVDLLVVRMTEVLVVVDTDNTVCVLGPIVDMVVFRGVEESDVAITVALGVNIDRGNVLRVDTWEVELT